MSNLLCVLCPELEYKYYSKLHRQRTSLLAASVYKPLSSSHISLH